MVEITPKLRRAPQLGQHFTSNVNVVDDEGFTKHRDQQQELIMRYVLLIVMLLLSACAKNNNVSVTQPTIRIEYPDNAERKMFASIMSKDDDRVYVWQHLGSSMSNVVASDMYVPPTTKGIWLNTQDENYRFLCANDRIDPDAHIQFHINGKSYTEKDLAVRHLEDGSCVAVLML